MNKNRILQFAIRLIALLTFIHFINAFEILLMSVGPAAKSFKPGAGNSSILTLALQILVFICVILFLFKKASVIAGIFYKDSEQKVIFQDAENIEEKWVLLSIKTIGIIITIKFLPKLLRELIEWIQNNSYLSDFNDHLYKTIIILFFIMIGNIMAFKGQMLGKIIKN